MTNFEIALNALNNITTENALIFKEKMKKVSDVFVGIKNECSKEQLEQLGDCLNNVSGCLEGFSEELDESGFLGVNDDELFAMLLFKNILEQLD